MPTDVEHLDCALMRLALAHLPAVGADRLDDLGAYPVDGVKRGHRVLEDHRDLLPADLLQLGLIGVDQLVAAQPHRALDLRVGRAGQPHDRLRGDALPGPRLADDRQHFAGAEVERDAVDRLQQAALGGETRPGDHCTERIGRALIEPSPPT